MPVKNQIFIQARLGSIRLPGKPLLKLAGLSVIEALVKRAKIVKHIDRIVLTTSAEPANNALVKEAERLNIDWFQGCEENTLDRFYQASLKFKPDNIIRLNGDCPLMDFNFVNHGLKIFLKSGCQLLTNYQETTFPYGADFEIFKASALKKAWQDNFNNFNKQRERFLKAEMNSVQYMLKSPLFKKQVLKSGEPTWARYRLAMDYPEDYQLIKKVFEELYPQNNNFTLEEVIDFLKKNKKVFVFNQKYNQRLCQKK